MAKKNISYRDEVRRKLVHLSSLWIPVSMCLFPASVVTWLFGILMVLSLIVEHEYARGTKWVIRLYDIFFHDMLRKKPVSGQWVISGGPYVFAAAFIALLFFPPPLAACGMVVMLLGDTAAALVGRFYGRHRVVNGKSIEGVLAFWVAGFAGAVTVLACFGYPGEYYFFASVGVVAASLVELFEKQLHLDDNLSIPLVMSGIVKLTVIF